MKLPTIGIPAATELVEMLGLIFARLETEVRRAQVETAIEEINAAPANQVLLQAKQGDRVIAAVWVQLQPGGVASFWPPGIAAGETAAAATLVDLALSRAAAAGASFAQSLIETNSDDEARALTQCGFKHAAELLYLVSPREEFPTAPPTERLLFEPLSAGLEQSGAERSIDAEVWARLHSTIQGTYQDTLDCPAVQSMRDINNVLAGYRAVGEFDPVLWFLVREAKTLRDVGCLLLARHPAQKNIELVYMGIVPTARGHGYGLDVIRHAQWLCRLSDAERLVLAVDAANSPAIRAYATAGLQTWDHRSVFLLADISRRFSSRA